MERNIFERYKKITDTFSNNQINNYSLIKKNIKRGRLTKNKLPTTNLIDHTLIKYDILKNDIHEYFPICYKSSIKKILYKLYLLSNELNNKFFEDDKKIKMLLHTTFIILKYNIDDLNFENIYGFYKKRLRLSNQKIDHISDNIETRIICNYLLEKCFLKSYSLLIQSNLNNIDITKNIEKITPLKDDSIVYDMNDIDNIIRKYIFELSDLKDTTLSKCAFDDCNNYIDLTIFNGLYVLSHSLTRIDTACIVPDNTLYIFLQEIGNTCSFTSTTIGNSNLLVVYEMLRIITNELHQGTLNLNTIEHIMLKDPILQDIYKKEFGFNKLKTYGPGRVVFNQSINLQRNIEYSRETLIEQSKSKEIQSRVSSGIISFDKLLKYNKINAIHIEEPKTIDNELINMNIHKKLKYEYETFHNILPLTISRRSNMGRILDPDNIYYKDIHSISKSTEPTILDLTKKIYETQNVFKNVDKLETQKEKEEKVEYYQKQLDKKGYIEIGKKINIVIFSMCRDLIHNEGIVFKDDTDTQIIIPIQKKENLETIIPVIDGHLNYISLCNRFKHHQQQNIIPISNIISKLYIRIQYTNYPKRIEKSPQIKSMYENFNRIHIIYKIQLINHFLESSYGISKEYHLNINDKIQYIKENPNIYKLNVVIFILMTIDLGLEINENLNKLLHYYQTHDLLYINNYYTQSLPMSDYLFLYYLSTL